jgi:hypothetical protein
VELILSSFKKEKPQIVHSIVSKAGLLTMIAGKCRLVQRITSLDLIPTKKGFFKRVLIFKGCTTLRIFIQKEQELKMI